MDQQMSDFYFKLMSLGYKFRDLLKPRRNVLNEADIKPGAHILDYGCGPGSCTIIAAEMTGATGKVYALDIHPLALQTVRNAALKKGLSNIETIHSDCATGLESESIDIILLYDVFHGLGNQKAVLEELHRVLKSGGILSFNDHHLKEEGILSGLTEAGLFKLAKKGKTTFAFTRAA